MRASSFAGWLACASAVSCGGASVTSFSALGADAAVQETTAAIDASGPVISQPAEDAATGSTSVDASDHDSAAVATTHDASTVDVFVPPADAGSPTVDAADAAAPASRQILCGAISCDPRTQFCCAQANGVESCQTTANACDALGGTRRDCGEASDCPTGNVCCYDFSMFPASASCRNDCNGGGGATTRVQACASESECLTGTCETHGCVGGGAIESCQPFPPQCP